MNDRSAILQDARVREAVALLEKQRGLDERADRVVGFGVTILAGGGAVAIANGHAEVLLGAGTLFALLAAYALNLWTRGIALGLARGRLAEVLADQLGEGVLIGEAVGSLFHMRDNPSLLAIHIGFGGLGVAATAAGFAQALHQPRWVLIVFTLATVFDCLLVALAYRDMVRIWPRTREVIQSWPPLQSTAAGRDRQAEAPPSERAEG
jgi:hypothetical protein